MSLTNVLACRYLKRSRQENFILKTEYAVETGVLTRTTRVPQKRSKKLPNYKLDSLLALLPLPKKHRLLLSELLRRPYLTAVWSGHI